MKKRTTPLETKTVFGYNMLVAGKEYTLPKVTLTKSPFDEKWALSHADYKLATHYVCAEILADIRTPLSFEELEFLRKRFDINQNEIARVLEIDESTVSKWRKQRHGSLSKSESLTLKQFFSNKFIEQHRQEQSLTNEDLRRLLIQQIQSAPLQGNVFDTLFETIISAASQASATPAEAALVELPTYLHQSYEDAIVVIESPSEDSSFDFDYRRSLDLTNYESKLREV